MPLSPEKERERNKRRRQDPAFRERQNERNRQWHKENPEKARLRRRKWLEANRDRFNAYARRYRRDNAVKFRERERLRYRSRYFKKYGLTPDSFQRLWDAQGGRCPICQRAFRNDADAKQTERAVVDHDHETQRVRGLLCGQCNAGVGLLGDTEAALQRAVDYLKGRSEHG